MKIGLVGCGNISSEIVKVVNDGKVKVKIISLFDKDEEKSKKLAQRIHPKPKITSKIPDFLEGVDLVVEAASQEAVKSYAPTILENGENLMIMSVGALVDESFLKKLKKIAQEKGVKIYIPSGAILGLDGVKAGKVGKIRSITLTTRKNPRSLGLKPLKKEKILFSGSAKEAVKKFPKNINVAATLSLVGIGFEKTKVKIIADPKVKNNTHEIKVKGNFGEFVTIAKNKPSPNNPKTSYLAVLSAISTLKKISEKEEGMEIGV